MKELLSKIKTRRKAFTLVEVILAVTIIGLVITAIAQLTQGSVNTSRVTINNFIAHHLAEEGVEAVRNIRDSNWLLNYSFNEGLAPGLYELSEDLVRGKFSLTKTTQSGQAEEIKLTGSPIVYHRLISIEGNEAESVLLIKSTVFYDEDNRQKRLELATKLTDWKKGPL